MKFVNINSTADKDTFYGMLSDNERTNRNVIFEQKLGRPFMHIKEKGNKIKIKCELMGRATKDNGFLEGTYFLGKIKTTDFGCNISGIIVTAPIFHLIMLAFFALFVVQCFFVGGFSVMPILLVIFDVFMFLTEFKKQRIIYRYIDRAARRAGDPKYER